MTHEEVKILLNDYFDEKLSIEVNTEIQVHLSECTDCSQYLFSLQDLMKKADQLPRHVKPPTDFWPDIFASLSDIKSESIKQKEELDVIEAKQTLGETEEEKWKRQERLKAEKVLAWERKKVLLQEKIKKPSFLYSLIGLVSVLVLFLIYNIFFSHGESWEVKKVRLGNSSYSDPFADLSEDGILETNSITRLQVNIPDVGNLFLDPETKIQRLKANDVRLLKGTIVSLKDGAKKFLSIEVPGAEIKDYFLGGQSKITFINEKLSLLEVTYGWTSINKDNLESLALPNHICMITADSGVGLPYRNGSSKEFVEAINDYCFTRPGNEEALIAILTKADVTNSVTLWNLLKRVTRKQREMVIYTIFGLLGEPPAGVTHDGLQTLDITMLKKLIEEIELKI
jgi:hypothetical protein